MPEEASLLHHEQLWQIIYESAERIHLRFMLYGSIAIRHAGGINRKVQIRALQVSALDERAKGNDPGLLAESLPRCKLQGVQSLPHRILEIG
jgi:hypothetical protein